MQVRSTRCFGELERSAEGSALPGTRPRLCSFPLCVDIFLLWLPGFTRLPCRKPAKKHLDVRLDLNRRRRYGVERTQLCTVVVSSNIRLSATGSADNLPMGDVEREAV